MDPARVRRVGIVESCWGVFVSRPVGFQDALEVCELRVEIPRRLFLDRACQESKKAGDPEAGNVREARPSTIPADRPRPGRPRDARVTDPILDDERSRIEPRDLEGERELPHAGPPHLAISRSHGNPSAGEVGHLELAELPLRLVLMAYDILEHVHGRPMRTSTVW